MLIVLDTFLIALNSTLTIPYTTSFLFFASFIICVWFSNSLSTNLAKSKHETKHASSVFHMKNFSIGHWSHSYLEFYWN